MTFRQLKYLCYSDLYRYTAKAGVGALLRQALVNPGFEYSLAMRACAYFGQPRVKWPAMPIYVLARLLLAHCRYRYGISISPLTEIGPGFYIGHFGGIVVSPSARIGRNCNISHGVTLGQTNRGERKGCPVLGDNIYIGPGAKIIGGIRVGSNVAVGANCVVTKDVPDNSVVVGVPGRVISQDGSEGYVCKTDYDGKI